MVTEGNCTYAENFVHNKYVFNHYVVYLKLSWYNVNYTSVKRKRKIYKTTIKISDKTENLHDLELSQEFLAMTLKA